MNGLKPYIVATNTNVTCVCIAKNKNDAISRCKRQYYSQDDGSPDEWVAYDFVNYFTDMNEYERDMFEDVLVLQSLM